MEPKEVFKSYSVELLSLPVHEADFIALLKKQGLLRGDLKGRIQAIHLTEKQAAQLLVNDIEKSLVINRDGFDKLILVMKQYKDRGI